MHVLWLLRHLGLDPASAEARGAVGLVRDHVTWQGSGPQECDGNPFFTGEGEPCINGQVAAAGAYFGQDVRGIVDRLPGEQLPDGGWNCEAPNGSRRSSFNTTFCLLEALLEHERATGGSPGATKFHLTAWRQPHCACCAAKCPGRGRVARLRTHPESVHHPQRGKRRAC